MYIVPPQLRMELPPHLVAISLSLKRVEQVVLGIQMIMEEAEEEVEEVVDLEVTVLELVRVD